MSDLYTNAELLRLRGKRIKIYEGTVTDSGHTQATPIDVAQYKEANFFIDCTAHGGTGTPTLNVVVQTKNPGAGISKWHTIATFAELGTTGSEMKAVAANLGEKIAIAWTKGGATLSATFTVWAWVKI